MSKEIKPLILYYVRNGWHDQLLKLCDLALSKKGKDNFATFWRAFAVGMTGNVPECMRQLESLQSRRDLQFPASLALIYFHKQLPVVDREALDNIRCELSVTKDVSTDSGKLLAARFSLCIEDIDEAVSIARSLIEANKDSPKVPLAQEAACIEYWCSLVNQISPGVSKRQSGWKNLKDLDSILERKEEEADIDILMLWVKSNQLFRQNQEALHILNQIIAIHQWFTPALTEKALMLASMNEWEQALDTTQRVLDAEPDNIIALQIVAVHAFTQESQPHDALQKLEDFDKVVFSKEPSSVTIAVTSSKIFSCICCRQPRALQICLRMLERVQKFCRNSDEESKLLCEIGSILLLQGPLKVDAALKAFKEALRRDAESVTALEGMIKSQLIDGAIEDAEGQLELLLVMHDDFDTDGAGLSAFSVELNYFRAMLAKVVHRDATLHMSCLNDCKDRILKDIAAASDDCIVPFAKLRAVNPDMVIMLGTEFISLMETTLSVPISTASSNSSFPPEQAFTGMAGTEVQSTVNYGDSSSGTSEEDNNNSQHLESGGAGGLASVAMADYMEVPAYVESGMELLNLVLRLCPGIVVANIELARCLSGRALLADAMRYLNQGLALQPQNCAMLIHVAKIEVCRRNTVAAARALEQALAADFSIRNSILFRLVQVYVKAQQGKIDESLSELEQIVALPEFIGQGGNGRNAAGGSAGAGEESTTGGSIGSALHTNSLRLTDDDRVSVYATHAYLLSKLKRLKEAKKILSTANIVFSGTAQEVQILVAASQLAVERNDFDSAIRTLDKISEESHTYSRAQMIKAEILLTHSRDKEGFTQCYHQLVEREPSAKNYALLGNAYLRILNPEAAVSALKMSYDLDKSNSVLRARLGKALIATHKYQEATNYYESVIIDIQKQGVGNSSTVSKDAVSLSHDLAKLYGKLGRCKDAIYILNKILRRNHRDINDMHQDVKTLLLTAQIHRSMSLSLVEVSERVIATLQSALEIQKEIVSQLRSKATKVSSSTELLESEKVLLSDICEQLGTACIDGSGQTTVAMESYFEATQYNSQNTHAILGIAKILKRKGNLDDCAAQCQKVLHLDPKNEEAAILLSEALFAGANVPGSRSLGNGPGGAAGPVSSTATTASAVAPEGKEGDKTGDTTSSSSSSNIDNAVAPLQELLNSQPNNYHALEKMIGLLRRGGKLEIAPAYLKNAENNDRRATAHAGFHFCQGLYARFTNDIGKAIAEFNLARRDDKWGHDALVHMIELYLNPDQDGAWEERSDGPVDDNTSVNIAAADTLLKELEPKAKDLLRYKVLENNCLLSSRQKSQISKAMASFINILEKNADYLPAILGMATGFMVEKNEHKARNLLKRVAKMELSEHDGEDFEKANLLLAKFYVDKSKYDLAQELCQRCLAHNKSSCGAWEILGLIFEKSSDYERASECYEKAWKLEFEASAPGGYRLAFSYLKSKKYVESIDICEAVLAQYPEYPRIREEILKKAYQGIRTK